MNEIIPFGKYKNQPIDVLAGDKQYTEWLCQQSWFINQFNQLHTIIINNFNQPSETPEHNKMVAIFLDDNVCINLFKKIEGEQFDYNNNWFTQFLKQKSNFYELEESLSHIKNDRHIYEQDIIKFISILENELFEIEFKIIDKKFETGNDIDLIIYRYLKIPNYDINLSINSKRLLIECKPTISEDYPAILRQCKRQYTNVLIVDNFISDSITFEQLKIIFGNIKVFMLHELI